MVVMPVIPDTWEAEVGGLWSGASPAKAQDPVRKTN
jgi:hypothetical protein